MKMKAMFCKQCGGNSFEYKEDHYSCKTCQTVFSERMEPSKKTIFVKRNTKILRPLLFTVLLVTLIIGIPLSTKIASLVSSQPEESSEAMFDTDKWNEENEIDTLVQGLKHIDEVEGWSEPYFESLSTTGQANIKDLIVKHGKPERILKNRDERYENGDIVKGTDAYYWESDPYDQHRIEIVIAINAKTGAISGKEVRGFYSPIYYEMGKTVFEESPIPNWSKAEFDKVNPATMQFDITTEQYLFSDGDTIDDILKAKGEATVQSFGEDDVLFDDRATVTYTWRKDRSSVTLIADEATGQVLKKEILA